MKRNDRTRRTGRLRQLAALGLICLVSCSAGGGSRGGRTEEQLWEDFEGDTTWAVESARGPLTLSLTKENVSEGESALKFTFKPADREDFEARREVRLDLSRFSRLLMDVYTESEGVSTVLAFKSGSDEVYFETPPVRIRKGWNRDVTFRLDTEDFNRFKEPEGVELADRDDVRRVMLVFFRDKTKAGEITVDNIRLEGVPQDDWQQLVPRIRSVKLSDLVVRRFRRVEMRVDFDGSFGDVFDPDDIKVYASMRDPNGREVEVPGFVVSLGDPEARAPRPRWLIRFTPTVVGKYEFTVTVENRLGRAVSDMMNVTAVENPKGGGFVRISKKDPAFFELDSGEPFYAVGHNVCWAGDYDYYLRRLSAAGENFTRVWICPWNLQLEKKGKLGQFDLAEAAKLDKALAIAEERGVRVMLVLQYHGMLNESSWDINPYNRANGGPCDFASDYFTSRDAKKYTRRFLRYAAARWGAYTSLMCWEFFNEVDLADYYDPDAVLKWHREMAVHMKDVDAHEHLLTSSAIYEGFYKKLWKLPELDFNTGHIYSKMPAEEVLRRAIEAQTFRKPFVVTEYGGGIKAEEDQKDPNGVRLHAALWSSYMSPAAGTAMPWWWDTHIEPNHLYRHFAGLSRFAKDEDRRGRRFRPVRAMLDASANRRAGVQGLLDSAGGYLWIYDPVWLDNPEAPEPRPIGAGLVVNVLGILDGPYSVEVWPTTDERKPAVSRPTAEDGKLSISLPEFTGDVAVKLKFLGQATPSVQPTAGRTPEVSK